MNKIIALILAFSIPSWGAVTFDAVGTSVDTAGVTTKDLTTLTVGVGSNRALIAQACWTGVPTAISFSWDATGTPQTVVLISSGSTTGNRQTCEVAGLVNPTSGAKTLRATWTGSQEIIMQGVSWTGVDQTGGITSFPNRNLAAGTSNTPSITITSAIGNATMDAIANGTSFIMNSVSATQTYLNHGATSLESGGSRAAGASSVTMTASLAGSDQWIAVGTDIAAVGAVAASVVCPSMGMLGIGCQQ